MARTDARSIKNQVLDQVGMTATDPLSWQMAHIANPSFF
jgi:hypothetical protein